MLHYLVPQSKRRQIYIRNKIIEAIFKHTKPTAEKIFSYLWKSDGELHLVVLQSYLEKLVEDKYL